MLKLMKWMVPAAALALLVGFQTAQVKAADETPAAAGKASIKVTVVNAEGKPVVNARVRLTAAAERGGGRKAKGNAAEAGDNGGSPPAREKKPKPIAEGTTDENGKATLTNIPDGSFTVLAGIRGESSGRGKVTVSEGKDTEVTITVKPRAAARGTGPTTEPAK